MVLSGSRSRTACKAGGEAGDDLRPVARKRLRHVLVGGALARPFRIELRVGLIGLGQRLGEAFTMRGRRGKRDATQLTPKADARSKHAPSNVANPSGTLKPFDPVINTEA